jgi:hypothetical protein
MDEYIISFQVQLKIINNMRLWLANSYMHLYKFCVNDDRLIRRLWKVDALETHILHLTKCDVLWVDGNVHSSFDLELGQSS